jgi:predicted nucleic acid-binding Zn ribbon protein
LRKRSNRSNLFLDLIENSSSIGAYRWSAGRIGKSGFGLDRWIMIQPHNVPSRTVANGTGRSGHTRRNHAENLHRLINFGLGFAEPKCSTCMNAGARTDSDGSSDTEAPVGSLKTESPETASWVASRSCVICGTPLKPGTRMIASSCSARCRSIKSRQQRLREVTVRLELAELRLREAADVLKDYRELITDDVGKVAP